MAFIKLEYIWLDGTQPTATLRSKTKVIKVEDASVTPTVESLPLWSFDGSSTNQAEGRSSDCVLKPVRIVADPERVNGFLVVCEVLLPNGDLHPTNTRGGWEDDSDLWIGFEQEYVLMKDGKPLGFPKDGFPAPQGPYYCGVGTGRVKGREIVEEHLDICLEAGLFIDGINAEVLLGQWEYQVFAKGGKRACDDLILARYLLERVCEQYDVVVELHPKPIRGNWNGSGMHTNFSNTRLREQGGKEYFEALMAQFAKFHEEHIAVYGAHNELRLTGLHETQSIDKFSWGLSDRGSSIRVPVAVAQNNFTGYIEDRRPASNGDPYQIVERILKTIRAAG